MTIPRLAYVCGLLLIVGGAIGLHAGGIWADENQAVGPVWLWLVPLAGATLLATGMVIQFRRHRSEN